MTLKGGYNCLSVLTLLYGCSNTNRYILFTKQPERIIYYDKDEKNYQHFADSHNI